MPIFDVEVFKKQERTYKTTIRVWDASSKNEAKFRAASEAEEFYVTWTPADNGVARISAKRVYEVDE